MAIRLGFFSSFECRAVPFNGRIKGVKINEEGCQMGGGWGGLAARGAQGPRAELGKLLEVCGRRSRYLPGQSCGDPRNDV